MMMRNPKFQIFKSAANGQYYYRLKASNGEIILSGEGYVTKQACRDGIRAVKRHAALPRYYQRHDEYMEYSFNLKADNGEIIGRSEMYYTPGARDNGIVAVKGDAVFAPVYDLS